MVPLIGLMIGFYIFTRMLETILNKETEGTIAAFAAITMMVVAYCVVMLLISGFGMPTLSAPPPMQ